MPAVVRRVHDTVGSTHRARMYKFELFEFVLLLRSDKRFPIEKQLHVEQFEAAVSQSTVPFPSLELVLDHRHRSSVATSRPGCPAAPCREMP